MRKKVLMVVKTYPTPSRNYGETVCTAGIDIDTGEWVRIYPYPFRTAKDYSRFKKYETFEFNLVKSDARDKRPESFRLIETTSAQKISEAIPTKGNWEERLRYLLPTSFPSVQALQDQIYDANADNFGRSLGLIQVRADSAEVTFEPDDREWDDKQAKNLNKAKHDLENNLFLTPEQVETFKTLEKLPYKTRVSFDDMTGQRHSLLVTDWEIGILFLKERKRLGEQKALENVKYKIEQQIFAVTNDVFLIIGSVFGHLKTDTVVVIGFVYPKKITKQEPAMDSLF